MSDRTFTTTEHGIRSPPATLDCEPPTATPVTDAPNDERANVITITAATNLTRGRKDDRL